MRSDPRRCAAARCVAATVRSVAAYRATVIGLGVFWGVLVAYGVAHGIAS